MYEYRCKIIPAAVALLLLLTPSSTIRASENILINDLIEDARTYHDTAVIIRAESIGEPMVRSDGVWVNVNDDSNAIGIWMNSADMAKIQFYGDYNHIGDHLEIHGIFSRNCLLHGGDVDIHATSVEVIESGYPVKRPLSEQKVAAAIATTLLTLLTGTAYMLNTGGPNRIFSKFIDKHRKRKRYVHLKKIK